MQAQELMIYKRIPKLLKRTWANIGYQDSIPINLEKAMVSFTFDDAPRSAFVNGGSVLDKYGYSGTYYVSMDFMGSAGSAGFDLDNLLYASANNHELACHTKDHLDISNSSLLQLKESIKNNQQALGKVLPGKVFRNFSYPFGSQTWNSKMHLSAQFKSARGNRSGINVQTIDRLNLKTIRLYEHSQTLDAINALLDLNEEKKGWLIFYTHGVQPSFGKDGCSSAYFDAVVKSCKRRQTNVVTVDKGISKIINQARAFN